MLIHSLLVLIMEVLD